MLPIDSFWVKPIKEAIDDKLLDMITAENKHNLLSEIKSYVQELLDYCPVASEKEFQEAVLDEYGVLYSADGRKLIKGNDDLKSYIIKPGTEIICDNAFKDCSLLGAINIPDSIRTIGHSAFCRCKNLESITFKRNELKKVGYDVFKECDKLHSIYVPKIFKGHYIEVFKDIDPIKIVGYT